MRRRDNNTSKKVHSNISTRAAELGDADAHCHLSTCIAMGRVLRRARRSKFIIWKRQQLAREERNCKFVLLS